MHTTLGKNLICSILGCWIFVHQDRSMQQLAGQMVMVRHYIAFHARMDWQTDMGSGSVLECMPFLEDNHGQGDILAPGQLQWEMSKRHHHPLPGVECMYIFPYDFWQNIQHPWHICCYCIDPCIFGCLDHIVLGPGNLNLCCIQQEDRQHKDFPAVH